MDHNISLYQFGQNNSVPKMLYICPFSHSESHIDWLSPSVSTFLRMQKSADYQNNFLRWIYFILLSWGGGDEKVGVSQECYIIKIKPN